MYSFNGNLISDIAGDMTGSVPSPKTVGSTLSLMFNIACKLEKLYDLTMSEYSSESEFFALLSDISDVLDDIDLEDVDKVRNAYSYGVVGSSIPRWIIAPMCTLYLEEDKMSVLVHIHSIVEECEFISSESLQVVGTSLYGCISAMFAEIYNTYGASSIIDGTSSGKDITRGYNEFLISVNKSPEEMAKLLSEKLQKFVHITNEVDRDKDTGIKVRSMVPVELRDDFEDVIELITEEQVEDILNGKVKVDKSFIAMLNEE